MPETRKLLLEMQEVIQKHLDALPLTAEDRQVAEMMGQKLFETAEILRREHYPLTDTESNLMATCAAFAIAFIQQDFRTRLFKQKD